MEINNGIPVFGSSDERTLDQARDVASRAAHVALMADNHLGYIMPIGGVAAYRNHVSVAGVGYDIACGNAAILTDLKLVYLDRNALADEIADVISFGMGRKNTADDAPVNHPLFDDPAWDAVPDTHRDKLKDKARQQLGTVGGGNHYVDVFADEQNRVWVGVHFGSRGFGHTVASGFLSLFAGQPWGTHAPETEALLNLDHEIGQRYWALMNLCGTYAYAGREWVARKVVELLGGSELDLVHNHHNFAWQEEHIIGGEKENYVVVRKGATPAFPGQRGFVGGSMGENSVILEGVDHALPSLYSTVHGAGRVMSRTAAAGKWDYKRRVRKTAGAVSQEMMDTWVNGAGVVLRGGGVDESPHVYKRLDEVLAAQGETIRVLHTLRPLVVVMAPGDLTDPYKD